MGNIKQNLDGIQVLLPGCECYRCQGFRFDQLPKPTRCLDLSAGSCNRCHRNMRTYLQPGFFQPKYCQICREFLQNCQTSVEASKSILQIPHCATDGHHVDCLCLVMERAASSSKSNRVSHNNSVEGCADDKGQEEMVILERNKGRSPPYIEAKCAVCKCLVRKESVDCGDTLPTWGHFYCDECVPPERVGQRVKKHKSRQDVPKIVMEANKD